jgi:hypothetical protein
VHEHEVDVDCEVVRTTNPRTLRCIKHARSYDRAVERRQRALEALDRLGAGPA